MASKADKMRESINKTRSINLNANPIFSNPFSNFSSTVKQKSDVADVTSDADGVKPDFKPINSDGANSTKDTSGANTKGNTDATNNTDNANGTKDANNTNDTSFLMKTNGANNADGASEAKGADIAGVAKQGENALLSDVAEIANDTSNTKGANGTKAAKGTDNTSGTNVANNTDKTSGSKNTDGTKGTDGTDNASDSGGADDAQAAPAVKKKAAKQKTKKSAKSSGTDTTNGANETKVADVTKKTSASNNTNVANGTNETEPRAKLLKANERKRICLDYDLNVFVDEMPYFDPMLKQSRVTYITGILEAEMNRTESSIEDYRFNMSSVRGKKNEKRSKDNIYFPFTEESYAFVINRCAEQRIDVTQYMNVMIRAEMNRFLKSCESLKLNENQKNIVKTIKAAVKAQNEV